MDGSGTNGDIAGDKGVSVKKDFSLVPVDKSNLHHYEEYEKAFETDLRQFQSRIYPADNAEMLRWYHITVDGRYIGAVWLEKAFCDDFAVLGIFIADKTCRNCGIGAEAIKRIIDGDMAYFDADRVVLRVREENERAVCCYKKVGFTESRRYSKGDFGVIEMIYEVV